MKPSLHALMWRVTFLNSGASLYFHSEESARIAAMEYGAHSPVAVYAPLYA